MHHRSAFYIASLDTNICIICLCFNFNFSFKTSKALLKPAVAGGF